MQHRRDGGKCRIKSVSIIIMYIFQPDRYILDLQIKEASKFIRGNVLDVGAGEVNRYSKYFTYDKYVRMDLNHGEKVDLIGSADNIPMPDGSFDSVICTQVFEHLKDPDKSAKEIYRVLKPGGTLLVTVPQMNELHEEPHDYWRYTKFGLEELFGAVGFKTIHIDQRGGFFSTMAQMAIRYMIDRFALYKKPSVMGKIIALFCKLIGKVSMKIDAWDRSVANRKHTIGWCFVFRK